MDDGALDESDGCQYSDLTIKWPKVADRCLVELCRGAGAFSKDARRLKGQKGPCLYSIVGVPLF